MIDILEKHQGVSLLDDTGLTEEDILKTVVDFGEWASAEHRASLLTFFKKKISSKTLRVLALIGVKYLLDDYVKAINEMEAKKAAVAKENKDAEKNTTH